MTTHSSLTYRALASGHSPSFSTQPGTGHPSSNLRGAVLASRSNSRGANKRPARQPSGGLMETHANSKFSLTNWNHTHLTNPNGNNKSNFYFHQPHSSIQPQASRVQPPDSNRQLETIRNGHNPFINMQMTFSNRPKKTEVKNSPSFALRRPSALVARRIHGVNQGCGDL